MPRKVPERTPAQQKTYERMRALQAGDVASMRAWAVKWGVHLFGDDAMVLWSIHDARAIDPRMPRASQKESQEWLKVNERPKE